MGMKPYKRAVAVTGTYTDRQGAEKKRYTNLGTLFQYDDGGFALKLDSVPVGDGWNGFISFYDIEEKQGGTRSVADKPNDGGRSYDLDDSVPF